MDEAFVMAQVQVRFRSVVQDVHFPVLERAHRSGVHIQVGVEFLKGYLESAAFQQRADGCRRQSFAERGDNTACDEDIFHDLLPSVCLIRFVPPVPPVLAYPRPH